MSELTIERASPGYWLLAEATVPRELDEVFTFFSDAANLERITPPWIRFQIASPCPVQTHVGTLIDYRLRIHGLPMKWRSEITAWEPPHRFVDEQRRGPYRFWRHEHVFESCTEGTRVIDNVHYGVPGGALIHALLVRRDVEAIFRYRQEALRAIFPGESLNRTTGRGDRETMAC
jgi:ligand-binding SRPBCC domain-containing protein